MINTVTGNVSRTHHPCGPCRALVETCAHYRPGYVAPSSNPRRAARRDRERRAAAAAVEQFRRQLGTAP